MKIAVLGANGRIGKRIYTYLLKRYEVYGFDLCNGPFYRIDLRKESKPFMKFDTVINTAGTFSFSLPPQVLYEDNVATAINAFRFFMLSEAKQFIHISTTGVYGKVIYLPADEYHPKNPRNRYETSKDIAEQKLLSLCRLYKREVIILRPSLVIGIEHPYGIEQLKKLFFHLKNITECIPFFNFGNKRIQLTSIEFICRVVEALIKKGIRGGIFNIAEINIYINDFLKRIGEETGIKLLCLLPHWLLYLLKPVMGVVKLHPAWIDYLSNVSYATERIENLLKS